MRPLVLFVFCAVFIFTGPALARNKLLDIQQITSPGGITAWLVEDHSVPVIALKFSFKGIGAALDPPDKQGLARMASNTMDEGAGNLKSQEFQKELRDLSINLYFNTGRDHFGGTLKTLTKNKNRAFELLHLALNQPRFDTAPVERMRKANQSRIRSSLSNPEWIAARILNDVAFAGHPYAHNSGGTLSTLNNITVDDLREFSKKLSKERLVVAVAGDIEAEELTVVLDTLFGILPDTTDIPAVLDLELQNQGRSFVYKKDIPQTIVEIIQPGIDRQDPDYHTAQVMNFILGRSGFGSRLTKEIREKRGLTYGIHSYFYDMDHLDGLSVSTSTENANLLEMLTLIKAEWGKMLNAPVTEAELQNAKSYLIGSLPLSLTSTDKIAATLLSLQLDNLSVDYLERREHNIRRTTSEDVQRVAQRILNPESFVTVLVGQSVGLENVETIETLPNVE